MTNIMSTIDFLLLESLTSVQKYSFCSMKPRFSVVNWVKWQYKLQHLFCGALYNQWKCKKMHNLVWFLFPEWQWRVKISLNNKPKETHEKYFYGTEHWNYFTNDEDLGPGASLTKHFSSMRLIYIGKVCLEPACKTSRKTVRGIKSDYSPWLPWVMRHP